MSPEQYQEAVTSRRENWTDAINGELNALIEQASIYRKYMSEAKTATKRAFYARKFKKIQPQVMQMVVALQRMNDTGADNDAFPQFN